MASLSSVIAVCTLLCLAPVMAVANDATPAAICASEMFPAEDASCMLSTAAAPSAFILAAGNSHEMTVTIRFARVSGFPRLFVSNDGVPASPSHHVAASCADDSASSIVTAHCPDTSVGCTLRLTVVGDDAVETAYTAQATTTNDPVVLTTGWPSGGTLTPGQYAHFTWAAPAASNGQLITFTLTSLAGDPDLFVSCTSVPSNGHATWSSRMIQDDQVQISATDGSRCNAPTTYNIAVQAAGQNSSYLIVANYGKEEIQLTNGQPLQNWVVKHGYQFYQINVPAGFASLEIDVAPSYGDPDLYVDLGSPHISSGGHHNYSSNTAAGEDRIVVRPTDTMFQRYCDVSKPCPVFITVYGYKESGYTVTAATASTSKTILDGVPYLDHVGVRTYTYYTLNVRKPNTPVTITLSPQTGDPDMYVSCTIHKPSSGFGQNTWHSNGIGVDQVLIPASQACPTPAKYYIGVRSVGFHNSTYTILGWVAMDGHPIELAGGSRQDGSGAADSMTYYQLTHQGWAEDIEFVLNSHTGDAVGYVNNVIDPNTGQVKLPTVTGCNHASGCVVANSKWSTQATPGSNSVTIPITSSDNCATNCAFVIGVYCQGNVACTWSVAGVTSEGLLTLAPDWPVRRTVAKGDYDYYRAFVWANSQDLVLTLTSFYGDADMYISDTTVRPSTQNYKWSAQSGARTDFKVLQASQLSGCTSYAAGQVCELFISVRGFVNSSYSLVMQYDDESPVTLSAGMPLNGFVNTSHYAYYRILAPQPASDIHISVTPAYGDADLYVATNGQVAGLSNHQYASTLLHGTENVVIPAESCQGCNISVAVYGFHESSFTVQYSLANTINQLMVGVPASGAAPAFTTTYYAFYNPGSQDITIALTPLSGDPDAFVGFANPEDPSDLPSWGDYIWRSTSGGADVVYITHTDEHYCSDCTYVIGIYGFSNSTFTLTVTTSETTLVQLVDGMPQLGAGLLNQYRYFTFRDHQVDENVTFTATPMTGNVALYVTNQYAPGNGQDPERGRLPTSTEFLWNGYMGYGATEATVTVTPQSPGWHNTVTGLPYTIGVLCSDQATFNIVAETSSTAQVLQLGYPSSVIDVAAGKTKYFKFFIPSVHEDVTVAVTALSGYPHIMLSTTNQKPSCTTTGHHTTCTGYNWQATDNTFELTVDHLAPCTGFPHTCTGADFRAGYFFVGIYGMSASTFTVTATTTSQLVSLTNGVPYTTFTTLDTVCVRSAQTGACTGPASSVTQRQGMNFALSVPLTDQNNFPTVSVTVTRACQRTHSCTDSLTMYANTCAGGDCTAVDQFPSPVSSQFTHEVSPLTNSLTLNSGQLDACIRGDSVDCSIYVSVYTSCTSGASCPKDTITVVYNTASGTTVVSAACANSDMCGGIANVEGGIAKRYAVYLGDTAPSVPLSLQLDACAGSATAYLCNDRSDMCLDFFNPSSGSYQFKVTTADVWLSIPSAAGTWFVSVVGDGNAASNDVFDLNIGHNASFQQLTSPQVQVNPSGTTAAVSWTAPTAVGGAALKDCSIYYTAVAVPRKVATEKGINTASVCGVLMAAFEASSTGSSSDGTSMAATHSLSATLNHLKEDTEYVVNVIAVVTYSNGATQQQALNPVSFKYTSTSNNKKSNSGGGLGGGTIAGIVILVLAFVAGGAFMIYWVKFRRPSVNVPADPALGSANQYNLL